MKFKIKTSEAQVLNAVLDYLEVLEHNGKDVWAYRSNNTGIYDPVKKCYRRNKRCLKGVLDVTGIYRRRPLYIETKSEKGTLSVEQCAFIDKAKSRGAVAFVARSIEDVKRNFDEIDAIMDEQKANIT
jgi:hypothetical protein